MKKLFLLLLVPLLFISCAAFAQVEAVIATPDDALTMFFANNLWAAKILTWVYLAQFGFKQLCLLAKNYVEWTPDPRDNEKLFAIMSSGWYKSIVWFFDTFARIKLPQAKKPDGK